jgi:chromosome segregation ATPase
MSGNLEKLASLKAEYKESEKAQEENMKDLAVAMTKKEEMIATTQAKKEKMSQLVKDGKNLSADVEQRNWEIDDLRERIEKLLEENMKAEALHGEKQREHSILKQEVKDDVDGIHIQELCIKEMEGEINDLNLTNEEYNAELQALTAICLEDNKVEIKALVEDGATELQTCKRLLQMLDHYEEEQQIELTIHFKNLFVEKIEKDNEQKDQDEKKMEDDIPNNLNDTDKIFDKIRLIYARENLNRINGLTRSEIGEFGHRFYNYICEKYQSNESDAINFAKRSIIRSNVKNYEEDIRGASLDEILDLSRDLLKRIDVQLKAFEGWTEVH